MQPNIGAAILITSSLIFLRISFLSLPLTSAARGSTGIFLFSVLPSGSVTVSSRYRSSSGKDMSGSPSIRTASTRSLPCMDMKVSISLRHHMDSLSLGEQITRRKSEFLSASVIGSARLVTRGSSSLSLNTRDILVLLTLSPLAFLFLITLPGSLKLSSVLCRFSATKLSSSECL